MPQFRPDVKIVAVYICLPRARSFVSGLTMELLILLANS